MKLKKFLPLIFGGLFIAFWVSFSLADEGVVAVVNNEVITQKDLNNFINFMKIQLSGQYTKEEVEQRVNQMLPDLISRLIEDRLILQAAYKENISVNQSRIDARIEQIKRRYASETDFLNDLTSQGLSLADIETKIREQFLMFEIIDSKVKSKVVVKPQEVTAYYYAHKKDFGESELRWVRFLTVKDLEIINELEQSLYSYRNLDQVAAVYSLEITDLGWVTSKQLNEQIAKIVFNLEEGKISPLMNLEDNNYLFEVKQIQPSKELSLSQMQDEISKYLFEKKMKQALKEWLDELKSKAYIEVKKQYGYD
jgi:parvulin-like peptidyl-prolyl isomerase